MTMEITSEDRQALEQLVVESQLASLSEAVHYCIQVQHLYRHEAELPMTPEWEAYAKAAIEEGLAQIEAGNVIDGDEFLRELRSGVLEA